MGFYPENSPDNALARTILKINYGIFAGIIFLSFFAPQSVHTTSKLLSTIDYIFKWGWYQIIGNLVLAGLLLLIVMFAENNDENKPLRKLNKALFLGTGHVILLWILTALLPVSLFFML